MRIEDFKEFAQNAQSDDVAALGAVEKKAEDSGRLGVVKADDGVTREDRCAVRQIFIDVLKEQFQVKQVKDIPKSVLRRLKLQDFDLDDNDVVRSRKPLTARRIQAVTAEVNRLGMSYLSKWIRSGRGRNNLLRAALDGLARFSEAKFETRPQVEELLKFVAEHAKELGNERVRLFVTRLEETISTNGDNLGHMFARALLGKVLTSYSGIPDEDLKWFSLSELGAYAKYASHDLEVQDREDFNRVLRDNVTAIVRKNLTDAESREMMELANRNAPPPAAPAPAAEPRQVQPVQGQNVQAPSSAFVSNKFITDNLQLFARLLHRDDVWTVDNKGRTESVRETLENKANAELVESVYKNWVLNGKMFSTALGLLLDKLPPEDNAEKPQWANFIYEINKQIARFANPNTKEEDRNAACDEIEKKLETLAGGMMGLVQNLLNQNMQVTLDKVGFGGSFKGLPKGQSPVDADLLALAKRNHPDPKNETTAQRKARESEIMSDYAKLVVAPEAGGFGTLVKDLASNYLQRLNVREQRAMIAGALSSVTAERLTDLLGGKALTVLAGVAYLSGNVPPELEKVFETDPKGNFKQPAQQFIGALAGGVLKGSGPVLQKMVQMLGVDNMPEYLRDAVRDCKSRLKPIPEAYVKAKLDEIVRRSNGEITNLELKNQLGAASIAQVFICELTDKAGRSRKVAVKMLRPDVRGRMEREIDAIRASVATADGGALRMLNARINSLLSELNFIEEGANIDACLPIYGNREQGVSSIARERVCPPMTDVVIMEAAPGMTFQAYMDETIKRVDDLLKGRINTNEDKQYVLTAVPAAERQELAERLKTIYRDVKIRHENLQKLVKLWFDNAVYGTGRFHGDLHGGNIMVAEDGSIKVIDFGNAPTFSGDERKRIVKTIVATLRGKTGNVLSALSAIVSPESRAALQAHREQLEGRLDKLFASSNITHVQERLTIIFGELARVGVEIPPALYNFVEAYGRLQQLSASMEATLGRISGALPFLRERITEGFLNDEELNVLSKESRIDVLALQSIDALVDDCLRKEINQLRTDTPNISNTALFDEIVKKINDGDFRLDLMAERRGSSVRQIVGAVNGLLAIPYLVDHVPQVDQANLSLETFYTVDNISKMLKLAKGNVDKVLKPYVQFNPKIAGTIEEMNALLDRAFDSKCLTVNTVACLNFVDYDSDVTVDYRLAFPEEDPNKVDAEVAVFSAWKTLMRDKLIPDLADAFQNRLRQLLPIFRRDGFDSPKTLSASLVDAVRQRPFKTLGKVGLSVVPIGIDAAGALAQAPDIRANFGVNLNRFRDFARQSRGRVHVNEDREVDVVAEKSVVSLHNAEARRALVEALIVDSNLTKQGYYESSEGGLVAMLLGLDIKTGETMNNVEKAEPLTTEMLGQILAVHDMSKLNRASPIVEKMTRLFGRLEGITFAEFNEKLNDASKQLFNGETAAASLGMDQEALESFLRANYGKVMMRLNEIMSADPTFAKTGKMPSDEVVRRQLLLALVDTVKADNGLKGSCPDVTVVAAKFDIFDKDEITRIEKLKFEEKVFRAFLAQDRRGINGLFDYVNEAKALRPGSFRTAVTEEERIADNQRLQSLMPAGSPDNQYRLDCSKKLNKLGFLFSRLAQDQALREEYLRNRQAEDKKKAETMEKILARVRQTLYVTNPQPAPEPEDEMKKLTDFWDAWDACINNHNAQVPPPEEKVENKKDEASGFFGLFKNMFFGKP